MCHKNKEIKDHDSPSLPVILGLQPWVFNDSKKYFLAYKCDRGKYGLDLIKMNMRKVK